jgi:hypothetical protein
MVHATLCLERRVGDFGVIEILERGSDGARLYVQNEQVESFALPGGTSLLGYVQAMRAVLLAAGSQRVAVLGSAGGTLGTMLARHGASPVLIDVNPEAFELAEKYFWLPASIARVVADARRYLADGSALFDAIVLDAFDGGEAPDHLASAEFFRLARRRLLPQGLVVVNAPVDRRGRSTVAGFVAAMTAEDTPLSVFEGPRHLCRNAVIVGGYLPEIALPRGDEPAETVRELAGLAVRRAAGAPVTRPRRGSGR